MRRIVIALAVLAAIQIAPAAGQSVTPRGDTVIYLDVSLTQCGAQGGTMKLINVRDQFCVITAAACGSKGWKATWRQSSYFWDNHLMVWSCEPP